MSTCGKRGCCCCCNKRDLTVLFGFILAAIAVAVPIVIHETDQEYGLTVIKFIRQYLGQNEVSLPKDQQLNNQQLNPHQKYKYASDLHYRGSSLSTIFGIWKKLYYVKFILVGIT